MEKYYTCANCAKIHIKEGDTPPDSCEVCGDSEFVQGLEIIKSIGGLTRVKKEKRSSSKYP